MRSRPAARLIAALVAVAPAAGAAQVRPGFDLTTADWRFAGRDGQTAMQFSPSLDLRAAGWLLAGRGTIGYLDGAYARGAFHVEARARRRWFGLVRPELAVRGGEDRIGDALGRSRLDGHLRLDVGGERLGAWLGGGTGGAWHNGESRRLATRSAGAWFRAGGTSVRVSYAATAFRERMGVLDNVPGSALEAMKDVRFADLEAELGWQRGRLELSGTLGRRFGGHGLVDARLWGGVGGALRVTDVLSVVLRRESAPADPTQHLPARSATSFGFRFSGPPLGRAAAAGRDPDAVALRLVLARSDGALRTLRLRARGAARVELSGSFTAWEPVTLRPAGNDWWEGVLAIPAGVHQLNVRIDGGAWTVPDGLRIVPDDFNGIVGLLAVD